jgi:hypothetical protein
MTTDVTSASPAAWAQATFGHAQLGDVRRTDRLVEIGTQMATCPAGRVTTLFKTSKEREGAYRFLENEAIPSQSLLDAAGSSTLRACADFPYLLVPVDGTSLNLADPSDSRELGPLGTSQTKARGLQVMNAIAVSPEGTMQGLVAQRYWTRPPRPASKAKRRKGAKKKAAQQRSLLEKESFHWLAIILWCLQLRRAAGGPRLWFQLDRGADIGELYWLLQGSQDLFTVRAAHDRKLWGSQHGKLREVLKKQPVLGWIEVNVPARPNRPARQARLSVRALRTELRVKNPLTGMLESVELWAVQAREAKVPRGQERIEWVLWTNYEVKSFEDACLVVRGYTCRWRIEEMHRTWKTDCQVEKTLLVSQEAIRKWAVIGAAVATRIERLKRRAREEPEVPATQELSRHEIDATILLRQPKGYQRGDTPTLEQCVDWIAEIGGYTGRTNSRYPPGSTTIERGLAKIAGAAEVLEHLSKM